MSSKKSKGCDAPFWKQLLLLSGVDFLRKLLAHNGYEVKADEAKKKKGEEDAPTLYLVGVADVIFNPVIAVYQRRLKTFDGRKVTPAYWNQQTEDTHPNYWKFGKEDQSG